MNSGKFKDYFSENSAQYGHYRPHYPKELFQYLASISPNNNNAWDCACGTGQSAVGLSEYFKKVIATDAIENQIKKEKKQPGITYEILQAENTTFANEEIALITVAQALHWFKIESFFTEANRVLTTNGILAVWTYNLLKINEQLDTIIGELYYQILPQYWAPERKMVENGYSGISFPFTTIHSPSFKMQEKWDLGQLLGYIKTWSAIKEYKKKNKESNELHDIFAEISSQWGAPESKKTITWPLTTIIQKKSDKE